MQPTKPLSPRFVPYCNFCFGNTGRRTSPRPRSMINASRFNPERQWGRASGGGGHFTSPATVASSASPSAAATHTPSPLFSCQSKSRSSVRLLALPFFAGVGVSGMSSPSFCLTLPRPSSIPYYCFLCPILNPEEPIALKIARVSAVQAAQAVQSVAAAEGGEA